MVSHDAYSLSKVQQLPGVNPARNTANAHLLDLADDILIAVIKHVGYGEYAWPNFRLVVPLVTVCRRFHRLATPLLYLQIHVQGNKREINRHRSFSENPLLRSFSRDLTLNLHLANGDESARQLAIYNDYAGWFKEVRYFELVTPDASNDRDPALTAFRCLPLLESVKLSGLKWNSQVQAGISNLGNLKTLQLDGFELNGWKSWSSLKKKNGTGQFDALKLFNYRDSLEALADLVRWSSKLEAFQFVDPGYDKCRQGWSFESLLSILMSQKSHLKRLHLYGLGRKAIGSLDLSDFHRLESLTLSDWDTGRGTHYLEGLIAPNLRRFCWTFEIHDRQLESLLDLGQEEEDWIRALASAAIRRRAALREIHIQYNPLPWSKSHRNLAREKREALIFPWDRLDAIAEDLRAGGISLTYDSPQWTMEQILQDWADVDAKEA
ncbi:hypothetical protein ACJ41O_001329 [Fusarium nematophilum]